MASEREVAQLAMIKSKQDFEAIYLEYKTQKAITETAQKRFDLIIFPINSSLAALEHISDNLQSHIETINGIGYDITDFSAHIHSRVDHDQLGDHYHDFNYKQWKDGFKKHLKSMVALISLMDDNIKDYDSMVKGYIQGLRGECIELKAELSSKQDTVQIDPKYVLECYETYRDNKQRFDDLHQVTICEEDVDGVMFIPD